MTKYKLIHILIRKMLIFTDDRMPHRSNVHGHLFFMYNSTKKCKYLHIFTDVILSHGPRQKEAKKDYRFGCIARWSCHNVLTL